MRKFNTLRSGLLGMFLVLMLFCQSSILAQVTLTATGGTPAGSFATLSGAFSAINAGTHTGSIAISINGNTTEPATPTILSASGQGTALFTNIVIKPTVVATISGATTPGFAVINFDGSDNVTIDGSIAVMGTTRDLTIQNTAAITITNVACIRLIGRTTLGLGATNITIANCNITGNTSGNNGLSGSIVTSTYGIYAGSTLATTMPSSSGGSDYDNLIIGNNLVTNAYFGIHIVGTTTAQADNLNVVANTIGSLTNPIGFKGFLGQQLVSGSFTENLVTSIQSTASTNIAGVEVGGSASSGFQIRRNTISGIQQFSTAQYGAYGINVTGGTGIIIANNVIHTIQAVNYASTSTTFNAHGIRITSGTGHGIYYNSVNMYGAYTTPTTTYALSSALTVTSTAVTGINIRNNVFANKMTTNAPSGEFLAVYFPTNYNFANANLERNAYMVTADANHFVGKVGTTFGSGNYSDLNAWKTISQINNAANDLNSFPGSGNINAPFTSDTDLTIPSMTVTVLESAGAAIVSLGLPNVDRNNVNRPAGSGTAPDLGAYEFEGTLPSDLNVPIVSGVSAAPGSSCIEVSHTVTATIVEDQAMGTVTLSYFYNGVAQTPITMTLVSGTAINGTYSGTIPAAASANVTVNYSVKAVDLAGNNSIVVSGPSYTDNYLVVTASADQTINTGTGTTVSASANDPSFGRLLISEVVQFKTGTGVGPYPAYIPTADNDFVEIVNLGDVATNAGGYTMAIYGGVNGTYTIPANTIIPSGGTLVLAFSGTASDPVNRYYGMNLGATTSSGVANGYVLRNSFGTITDAVATDGYIFTGPSGVTATDWSGTIASSSGLAGVRRTVATDNNVATDWTVSSAANLMNIGVFNSEITIVPIPQTISWTNSFDATTSTNNPLTVAPFASSGTYLFFATFNDGTCTTTDTVVITAITPLPPVANFSATPLAGSAPLIVTFTDLSTNVPSAWAWTVSPMAGVTYVSGTNSSTQNPVIQFANAGMYTITLIASNVAGSDDSTKVQYINVNYCPSGATFTADTDIGNVTFGTLNNGTATPVLNNPAANGTYTDFTALPAQNFALGQTYNISLSQITSGATFYNAHFNAFIDFNNDGAFDPITERVFNAATASSPLNSTVTGIVTIPLTASLGNVRMRIILDESGNSASSPCGTFSYGETEDYLINIECLTTAPAAGSDVICSGETGSLTATGNSIQWYADAVTMTVLATGASYTTPILTATTSYFATATDAGCSESARTEFIVTVNQPTTSTQTVTTCGSTYTWSQNMMTYSAAGMYNDTITNAAGCDSIITLDLTFTSPTSGTDVVSSCDSLVWIDGVTYYANNNTATFVIPNSAGCDSTVTLNLTIKNSTSATQTATSCGAYTWSVNNMTYSADGMYTATIMNTAGCDSVITLNLTLNALPNLNVTVLDATLTSAQAPGAGISYSWLDCNNAFTPITGANSQSFTPVVNGNYAVQVNQNGCTDTSACTLIDNVGLNANNFANVSVVPNPTSDIVTITFEASEARLTILDMNGKLLKEVNVTSGSQLDLSSYESGVYLFTIVTDSSKTIKRVVKQ